MKTIINYTVHNIVQVLWWLNYQKWAKNSSLLHCINANYPVAGLQSSASASGPPAHLAEIRQLVQEVQTSSDESQSSSHHHWLWPIYHPRPAAAHQDTAAHLLLLQTPIGKQPEKPSLQSTSQLCQEVPSPRQCPAGWSCQPRPGGGEETGED